MKLPVERLLSLLAYFSGTIAAVAYFLGKGKEKAHGLQGLAFAAFGWTMEFFDELLRDLDILKPMELEGTLAELFPVYGSVLLFLARLSYYVAILIGLAAFFNVHLLFVKEQ